MKYIFIFILFLGCVFSLSAQNTNTGQFPAPGKITGVIKDRATKKPVEFAAVSVLHVNDSSILSGVISDNKGAFELNNIAPGDYILKVNFVGYKPFTKNISVNETAPEINTGNIFLDVSSTQLESVEISAKKNYFETFPDKKIYNVAKDIVSASGSAADLLQNIPSVTIDMDGNVMLRGNSSVRIFIDGKPSGIMADNMQAILQQIPASSIESIEVITNPSAKYEAEGTGGIINIVLKKNRQYGVNGNVSADAGTAPKYDASAALNYRGKKINVYSGMSIGYDNRSGEGASNRYNFFEDTAYYISSETNSNSISTNYFGRAGIDYFLSKTSILSASGSANSSLNKNDENINYGFYDADSLFTNSNLRNSISHDTGSNYNVQLNYKKSFKTQGHTLTADGYYSYGSRNNVGNYTQQFLTLNNTEYRNDSIQNIYRNGFNKNISAQTDYVLPLKNKNQIEAGLKFTGRINDNSLYAENLDTITQQFSEDTLLSNEFIYNENVFAAYFTYAGAIKKISYKAGLRSEQTTTDAKLVNTQQDFKNNYLNVFPSIYFSYPLMPTFDVSINYSRRINRPNGMQLNPFPDYSDAYSRRYGNPFLEPEFVNSYELEFTKTWENHTLDATAYYRQTVNSISRIVTVDTSGIANVTFENANILNNYGAEIIYRTDFFSWWDATYSINVYESALDASNIESGLANSILSASGKLSTSFIIKKQTTFQLSFNYMSPRVMAQGKTDPMYFADAGIKTDIFKSKATINLTLNDIFNTRRFGMTSEGINYRTDFYHKRESRIATLAFTYRFGNQDTKRRQNKNPNNDSDMQNGYDMF